MKFLLLILCQLVILSCESTQSQQLKDDTIYKRDISINGVEGLTVLPKQESYTINLKAFANIDMLVIRSCHREVSFYPNSSSFQYTYAPSKGLEDNAFCDVDIEAYNAKGTHSFGHIIFSDPQFTEKGTLRCNGETKEQVGISACQAKAGLLQTLDFIYPMTLAPNSQCKAPTTKDNKHWEFSPSLGLCSYIFANKNFTPVKYHLLVTFGYQSILVRVNK